MITGDIRNQVDRIWDSFWSGGISNPSLTKRLEASISLAQYMEALFSSLQHGVFRGELFA